ncbi:MAG: aspartate--ammonia ligase [Acidobacteria bacterium CG_4_9_14_3_um_filter_49_7]|nr:MAG: aspartate--ammonia ligase [Acidobacteria bacterium CG_4_9_14_3_um_filter_49_7]
MDGRTSIHPDIYRSILDIRQTETAIKELKDFFQVNLSSELNLARVTAPILVESGTGINDDLNGVERPLNFSANALEGASVEVVQSLAKWKRLACARLECSPGEGIYTDMNAIRPDEELDNLHSLYVDQWDWEKVILPEERTLDHLKEAVHSIFGVIRRTETWLALRYPELKPILPSKITFIHASDLAARWPEKSPRERENCVTRDHGAVFIIGIGANLQDGKPHDGRAPDYDDWTTPNGTDLGLNGDILVHHPVLNTAFELSSMGIRVNPASLKHQLSLAGAQHRSELYFHRQLLAGELPQTMGGGIGQSRLCMFLLKKAHIGEIQAGVWPTKMRSACRKQGIELL